VGVWVSSALLLLVVVVVVMMVMPREARRCLTVQ
jgi:hypothetical protein